MVAIKFYDDRFYSNEYYSRVGGIPCVEMNRLEADMLSLLDYDLTVTSEQYDAYLNSIERRLTVHADTPIATPSSNPPPSPLDPTSSPAGLHVPQGSA